jgi:hypothetical protein
VERLRKWARRYPSVVAAGVVVLVLMCVGSLLSTALVQREQMRTKAEQKKAEEAFQRERLRADEAEARFQLARRAVDQLFRVCEEELAHRPGLEWARKRLLTSVLAYYQEFIEQRRDDPQAQGELLAVSDRVKTILADLAVLRDASRLHLLCYPSVCDELDLSDSQRAQVHDFMARIAKRWTVPVHEIGHLTPAEQGRQFLEQAKADEAELDAILTQEQVHRLRQIGLQLDGPAAFQDPEVVAALRLTNEQRDHIRAIGRESLLARLPTRWPGRIRKSSAPPRALGDKPANERILALLTEEQTQRWHELTGEPVRLPVAPFAPPPPPPSPTPDGAKGSP